MKNYQYGGLSPEEILNLFRVQKHDHLNHLQVVLGYLQIERPEMALNYIKEVILKIQEEGKVFKINAHNFAFTLFNIIEEAYNLGLEPKINIETLFENRKNDLDLCLISEKIWNTIKAQLFRNTSYKKKLIIDIKESNSTYYLTFIFSLLDNVILKEETESLRELASFLEMELIFDKDETFGKLTLKLSFD